MNIVFVSDMDVGAFGYTFSKLVNTYTTHKAVNLTFGVPTFFEGFVTTIEDMEWENVLRIIREADFFIVRWLREQNIERLGLRDRIWGNNALIKLHGTEVRNGYPFYLPTWRNAWSERDLMLVSSFDYSIAHRLGFNAYHLPPFALDLKLFPVTDYSGEFIIHHAPTDRRNKGTDLFLECVNDLCVEYLLIERQPHEKCIELKKNTSAGFDQIGVGEIKAFGKNAVEDWALGLPVLVNYDGWLLSIYPELRDIAVKVYDLRSLKEGVELLKDNPDIAREMGKQGRRFIERNFEESAVIKRWIDMVEWVKSKTE